jgi:hypothetical protein
VYQELKFSKHHYKPSRNTDFVWKQPVSPWDSKIAIKMIISGTKRRYAKLQVMEIKCHGQFSSQKEQ